MKTILVAILLTISANSHAGVLMYAILGSALSSKKLNTINQDEFNSQIKVIGSQLNSFQRCPNKANTLFRYVKSNPSLESSKNSNCWSGFTKDSLVVNIVHKLQDHYIQYYENSGYIVRPQDSSHIIFDFSYEHQKYLEFKKQAISKENIFVIISFLLFGAMVFLIIIRPYRRNLKERNKLKQYIRDNISSFHFFESGEKVDFMDYLYKDKYQNKTYHFNADENGEVYSITFSDRCGVGVVARKGDLLPGWLGKLYEPYIKAKIAEKKL